MTKRTTIQLSNNSQTEEVYTYDAAGNIVGDGSDCGFVYDTNNRLTSYDGNAVEYDMDGNMTSVVLEDEITDMEYDSANRLTSAGANHYTYDAEDVRIRNLCGDETTTYTYNTNVKLSQLLMKTTGGVVTKYVYGLGLIGEECGGAFKTYHFDYRGSTVAITNSTGNVTDAFRYDTYGKMVEHVGSSDVIFGYNGQDGVVTEKNGLIYMRARYYSPVLRRFVNADVIAGKISNAITLNRYAYANGNPVSNIDPFGLSADRWIDNFRNKDGSYSLYDNDRFEDRNSFHEQILVVTPSGPSANLKEGNLGIGSISIDGFTGGWETENYDLSLLDFGHAEISAEIKDGELSLGAFASIWSPSFSFKLFGLTIELGAEVGAVGASVDVGKNGFKAKAAASWGLSLSVKW